MVPRKDKTTALTAKPPPYCMALGASWSNSCSIRALSRALGLPLALPANPACRLLMQDAMQLLGEVHEARVPWRPGSALALPAFVMRHCGEKERAIEAWRRHPSESSGRASSLQAPWLVLRPAGSGGSVVTLVTPLYKHIAQPATPPVSPPDRYPPSKHRRRPHRSVK